MTKEALCAAAIEAMSKAYAPYSGYKVGAALLTTDGKVYTGCNIENASYTPTVCAERTAMFKAVSEGDRNFAMIAICGGKDGVITGAFPPCGVCRQVMAEFCGKDMPVLMVSGESTYTECTLGELLPYAFGTEYIEK